MPCARFAFFTLARDSVFVALAAGTLMVGFSFEPPLAFMIGATVALIFSIGLLARGYFLTEDRFLRSEAWRALRPDERPPWPMGATTSPGRVESTPDALCQRRLSGCQHSLWGGPRPVDRWGASRAVTPS